MQVLLEWHVIVIATILTYVLLKRGLKIWINSIYV